jgi:hypothetical protein
MKQIRQWVAMGAVAVAMSSGVAGAAPGASGYTMFVVPARYSVVQVMFDVARRAPVALVSYQTAPGEGAPVTHVWNGTEWVGVPLADFRSGVFMRNRPSRVVLVGEPDLLPHVLAEAAQGWCRNVMTVTELDTGSLVNAAGQLLKFSRSDWAWFSSRYNMQMVDTNEARRRESWYQQPHLDLPKRERFAEPGETVPSASAPASAPAPVTKPEPPPPPPPEPSDRRSAPPPPPPPLPPAPPAPEPPPLPPELPAGT